MNPFQLKRLSNDELVSQLKQLVSQERKLLHLILRHICEVERRQLHLERAFSSLYDYLTREFGYSGAAAMRRIEAARLLRQVPELSDKIQSGAINLSQIGEVSKAIKVAEQTRETRLTAADKSELISKIENQTAVQTQITLAKALDITPMQIEKKRTQQDESVRLEITLSRENFELLQDCFNQSAAALSQKGKEINFSETIGHVCDVYLRKHARFPRMPVVKTDLRFISASVLRSAKI